MLELKEVELSYGRNKVLKKLNLEIARQELYALVGPENSGKSSVCKVAAGLVRPETGEVLIYNKSIWKDNTYKWLIGYLPERVEMYQYQQVLEYLIFFGELYGMNTQEAKDRGNEILKFVGLTQAAGDYLSKLSKGEKQKLLIGRAMIQHPQLLILDEVLTGLDPVSRVELQELLLELKNLGMSILFTSSDLDSASKFCDKVAIIDEGSIVAAGTVEEILHLKQSSNPIVICVNEAPEEAMKLLRRNPKISSISRKDNMISIWFDGEDGEQAAVLAELIQNGIQVTAFYREESDFDSLYLRITKRKER